ncbi:hypothetical protein GCM10027605_14520 [Micromonospora zhanjiangensis]
MGPAGTPERLLGALAGLTLLWLEPVPVLVGCALAAATVAGCLIRRGFTTGTGGPRAGRPADPREDYT